MITVTFINIIFTDHCGELLRSLLQLNVMCVCVVCINYIGYLAAQ